MLELEQIAGIGIDRAIGFLNRRKMEERMAGARPLTVEPELKRLGLTASLLFGRDMRVVTLRNDAGSRPYLPILRKAYHPALLPGLGFGWTDNETVYLPEQIVGMPDDRLQKYLLKLMIFFLSMQARSGSVSPGADILRKLESDQLLQDLYWITENSRLYAALEGEFPALFIDWGALASSLVEKRPGRGILRPAEAAVEAYLIETLSTLRMKRVTVDSPLESFKTALEIKRRMEASGASFKGYRGLVPFEPWGKFLPGAVAERTPPTAKEAEESPAGEGGRKKAKDAPRYTANKREMDEKASESGWMLNIYDKLLSWANFVKVNRPFDDDPDDEAAKKADEMDEITVAGLERRTNARFDAELEHSTHAMDDDAPARGVNAAHVYPEWDYKKREYRQGYVRLIEEDAPHDSAGGALAGDPRENGALVKAVRRKFEALRPMPALAKRLFDGEQVDVDALVEAAADLAAGIQPDERFYSSLLRSERDISTLFLIDLSMSTDAWVKDKRVIEHEKDAILLLCEALSRLGDRYAVHGFSGKSNKGARFFRIKDFDERHDEKVRARIKGLIPYYYTRMGPAIRHATKLLGAEKARIKLLFIISDGKPNDIDVYEGRYGIEDTRMAVREAERSGITPFCFTLDLKAGEYLPRLFGRGNYAVASSADKLAGTLPDLYARIVKSI
jgi:nitric oxide reductase NorD protein